MNNAGYDPDGDPPSTARTSLRAGKRRGEPMMALEIELAGQRLRSFSTLASFGTALDVDREELRIEHYFPADEATRRWFRNQIQ